MTNVLENIMGIQEAVEVWNISREKLEELCRIGQIQARYIKDGNGGCWILVRNQPKPEEIVETPSLLKQVEPNQTPSPRQPSPGRASMSTKLKAAILE